MRLVIFVHDFFTEVGHSRAMIELIRNLPAEKMQTIEEIKVVCYKAGNLEHYFPFPHLKLSTHLIPFSNLYPFILKSIFFQLYTFFFCFFSLSKKDYKIGIGIACMNVDIVNIQFIHHQYERLALQFSQHSKFKWIYKFMLFKYFNLCESILYHKKNLNFLVPAQFLKDYLIKRFEIKNENIKLTYSSVNINEFNFKYSEKKTLFNDLTIKYPILKDIDIHQPIFLFVGAFERKGLLQALDLLKDLKSPQFIIIGKSESNNRKLEIPSSIKSFHIGHTREIPLFYELADAFVFPTLYEPFGLVITEAFAMGLDIFVTENEVGATELIKNQEAVYLIEGLNKENLKIKVLSYYEKKRRRENRLKLLEQYSWRGASIEFYKHLELPDETSS